jgi:plastocyanin
LSSFYYTRLVVVFVLPLILWDGTYLALSQETFPRNQVLRSQEIVIDMESYVFAPSEVTISVDTPFTLILRNQSFLVPHNFLMENPHGVRVLEADISSGESQTHTLTLSEPGIYPFYCDKQLLFFPTHREEGMEGRLIVQ